MARTKERAKEYYQDNKDSYYFRFIKRQYGLDINSYQEMLIKQNSKCILCDKDFTELPIRQIHVDHCHETNTVRGLLCMKCNVGLGMLGDTESSLLKALAYIRGEI